MNRTASLNVLDLIRIFMLASVVGCGDTTSQPGVVDDSRKVGDVVDNFNDARLEYQKSEQLFVQGALPEKTAFKKYGPFSYMATGTPQIDGDSAKMEVTVRSEKTGEDAGKVEWTFKKAGDAWKIATAPLPES